MCNDIIFKVINCSIVRVKGRDHHIYLSVGDKLNYGTSCNGILCCCINEDLSLRYIVKGNKVQMCIL